MSRIFGPVRQNGYVVGDIEAALSHWVERLGVGPFYLFDPAPVEDLVYRGQPTEAQMAIALANSGPLQIELIEQKNDAPSMYRDFLAAGREGLQHIAYWTETMDADLKRLDELHYPIAQSGRVGEDGRFVYFDTESHPGTVVELSEVLGVKGEFFRLIAEEARDWQGQDPIRRIPA